MDRKLQIIHQRVAGLCVSRRRFASCCLGFYLAQVDVTNLRIRWLTSIIALLVNLVKVRPLGELGAQLSARRLGTEEHLELLAEGKLLPVGHLVGRVDHVGPDVKLGGRHILV